jgi:hypothetical protein
MAATFSESVAGVAQRRQTRHYNVSDRTANLMPGFVIQTGNPAMQGIRYRAPRRVALSREIADHAYEFVIPPLRSRSAVIKPSLFSTEAIPILCVFINCRFPH